MLDYRHETGLFPQDNLTLSYLGAGTGEAGVGYDDHDGAPILQRAGAFFASFRLISPHFRLKNALRKPWKSL